MEKIKLAYYYLRISNFCDDSITADSDAYRNAAKRGQTGSFQNGKGGKVYTMY